MNLFITQKNDFDSKFGHHSTFNCFLPVHLEFNKTTTLRKLNSGPNEEYFKWQFLYSIVSSGMYIKDYIGTEVFFPKGNKSSAPIKFDAAIFDHKDWFFYYEKWHKEKDQASLDWLRSHLLVVIEFKKENGKDIEAVWNQQLKPALKESERENCMGVIYDAERLFLFRKYAGKFLRLSEEYNQKGELSGTKDLSLHLPDPYINIPSFDELINWTNAKEKDRSQRTIEDLAVISGIHSKQINDAMSAILRTMDKQGMVNQRGYEILIQILALKIFDEKRNEKNPKRFLDFYITSEEKIYKDLNDKSVQAFIARIIILREEAESVYFKIFKENPLNINNANHIKVLLEVVDQFQDYSLVKSHKTDLYQLVFYRFANEFSKDQKAQFVTPLPLIDFIVKIVNPRNGETVIDPTVGIADFLSVAYVNSSSRLDDNNIYGLDIDDQMIMLATLNMLLNGDGNAILQSNAGYGSLNTKFDTHGKLVELLPKLNDKGEWDKRKDGKKIKRFDVVLTNPPFGEDRKFAPKEKQDFEVIECYELWHIARSGDGIDLGIIFLENAYRILKDNGRLGIVLSNSIASVDKYQKARQWLLEKMRIVAIFDLPPNVFAETGVPITVIVAYKPILSELKRLQDNGYNIFIKDIQKVGYEIRTSKRVKKFEPVYKIDYNTFDIEIDSEGRPLLDEEFSETILEFKKWCLIQEETLQKLFIYEK